MASIELTGSSVWGNGARRYAVYKVDISRSGESWTVYRRYNAFHILHTLLSKDMPEEMAPLNELLPEKGSMGSLLNSFEMIVNERLNGLRAYLQALKRIARVFEHPAFLDFLDVTNKGISGFRKDVGNTQVLKEGYAMTSRGNFDFFSLFIWQVHYVGLTKRGVLYVLPGLYEEPKDALVSMDLRSIDVRVGGDVGQRVVHVINGDTKIFIKFSTIDEFSSWLRQVSDFGIHTASQASTVGKINASKNAPAPVERTTQEHHVRSKGTGNTDDDLSAMYGM